MGSGLRLRMAIGAAFLVVAIVLVFRFYPAIPPLPEAPGAGARLVLVETQSFDSDRATIRLLERDGGNSNWEASGAPLPAMLGRNGVGWGHGYRHLAQAGEPIKREGDKRAPAGVFKLGRPFGFIGEDYPGYMQLSKGQHFCVDEPASQNYSAIVPLNSVSEGTSGERMWEIVLYRRGIVVDYPTDRQARSGSCIFVHVWKTPETPTSGCVAAAEDTVARLQKWVADTSGGAWIAIVPKGARDRLGLNLPQ